SYDGIGSTLAFSPDGKRVAYVAKSGDKSFVVVDGKEEKPYDYVGNGSLIFGPDSKRLAYAVESGKRRFVVIDGKEEKRYDDINSNSLAFSPDSKNFIYVAGIGNKQTVIINGEETRHYDQIVPSGQEIFIFESFDNFRCLALKEKSIYRVVFNIK
ncbi:MAG: hypothetical protein QMD11_01415, partial [Smithella sp.]|nr:hypothetical protein [Smithella sp.]